MVTAPAALHLHRETIAGLTPAAHRISFLKVNWPGRVNDPSVQALAHRGSLTRGDLTVLGDQARVGSTRQRRDLFAATVMWGYGNKSARGPRYANAALSSSRLNPALDAATNAIGARNLAGAWLAFARARVPGYNQGFFTKYLYFAARGDPLWEVRPLIYDSLVRDALSFLADWLGANIGPRPLRLVDRYVAYCTLLDSWATDLDVDGEQVEMFLYRTRGRLFDPAPVFRALASVAVADSLNGRASPQLAAAFEGLPPEVTVSYL
jgi:hypothetical protein